MTDQPTRGAFPTTRITLIEAACGEPTAAARDALSVLCTAYWYPIYAYIRRHGYRREDAEDLAQGFFTRVLEKHYLRDFERTRGRFRSFLLVALRHFIANERDSAQAIKRGGASTTLPLGAVFPSADQRYSLEPRHDLSPEKLFEQQWALAVLGLAQQRLQAEAAHDGKAAQFERLKTSLIGGDLDASYRMIAADLGTTEGAIKVAVHRWRRRFRELLREEISRTVDDPADVGHELRELMRALRA